MTNLHQVLQAIVTVLAVINPGKFAGSLFLTLTPNLTAPERRREAAKVALNILIILMGSALVGLKVLSIFGISLDVFRVVGGMIIAVHRDSTCCVAAIRSLRRRLKMATRACRAHLCHS